MNNEQPDFNLFIHALISPLTTLQGTIGLIRRRVATNDDPHLPALLDALERSAERLRTVSDVLIGAAALQNEQIQIDLPAGAFRHGATQTLASPPQPAAAVPVASSASQTHIETSEQGSTLILLIAAPTSSAAALADLLQTQGCSVVQTSQSATGIDLARELRPALVVLDPEVDEQADTALFILGEDPDTKTIALAVIGPESLSRSPGAPTPLSVDLQLPLEQVAAQLVQLIGPGGTARRDRQQILIVDDEPDIATMLALQFQAEGYLTSEVHSGTEVLRIVREQQFDLILLDVMLPDIDGFTVLGGLRAQPETQLTPIILVSAINSPAEKVRGLQLGADDYITKPFSSAELGARVQAAMRRSEREGGANPSTRLPGNLAIERAISQRITQNTPFTVCYCDLDNFKAYNDSYGFLKGDAVIQRTAQILLDAVRAHGNPDDFVGHIGGDDFVVISTPEQAPAICAAAIARFDETAPLFYDPAVRAQGYLNGVDRQGRVLEFPLVSLTISAVSSARRQFSHPGEVAQRAIDPKKRGKSIPGSVFLLEE